MNIKDLYNYPSICIPKVEKTIEKNDIFSVFQKYHFGKIKKIDLIQIGNFKKAFIHIFWDSKNDKAQKARNLLLNKSNFKIIYDYDYGWYWKCSASISQYNLPKINQP